MRAEPHDIKTVFGVERQLFAPLFQRPYVWEQEKQWEPLWQDVLKVATALLDGREDCPPHFLGAVVLEQKRTSIGEPDARWIIDGQQRLTTLQLMLEAIRDLCYEHEHLRHPRRLVEKLIYNDVVKDEVNHRFKLMPTNVDRSVYHAIMDTTSPVALHERLREACDGKRSTLAGAYEYFHAAIGEWLDLESPEATERCDALVNAIREKLRLVVIEMDSDDDAQMIFETLNARGTPLLPSDLVKNFLFQRAKEAGEDVERLHHEYWEPFDVASDFWRAEIRIGRLRRPRIDVFLGHYLSLQKGDEVPLTELFQEYKKFAAEHPDKSIEWHLKRFHDHAKHFERFQNPPKHTREGVFFNRLETMETTTVYPFLLGLYEANGDEAERVGILEDLESFLVRRMVCGLSTKSYTRLFLDLIAALRRDGGYVRANVQRFLREQEGEAVRWPTDFDFEQAWISQPLYRSISRGRLRMILQVLDSQLHGSKTEKYQLQGKSTVEHLLPQHWEKYWPLSVIEGESEEERTERTARRNHMLQTIGNLTFLTKSLNPAVSNGPFAEKKSQIAKHSPLNLNRFLHDVDEWDEDAILARSRHLFKEASQVWARPEDPEDLQSSSSTRPIPEPIIPSAKTKTISTTVDRNSFWAAITKEFNELGTDFSVSGQGKHYMQIRIGVGNVHYEWLIGKRLSALRVSLHFEHPDAELNSQLLNYVAAKKDEITEGIEYALECGPLGKQWTQAQFLLPYSGEEPTAEIAPEAATLMKTLIERTLPLVRTGVQEVVS